MNSILAGVIVGVVALLLAMVLAITSGAKHDRGTYVAASILIGCFASTGAIFALLEIRNGASSSLVGIVHNL